MGSALINELLCGDGMAIGSFEDLCEGFCELVGVPAPMLTPDSEGLVACHVDLRDVIVNLVHSPNNSTDHLFVLVECGLIPEQGAQRIMQTLLEANFFRLEVHPPTFGRN